MCGGATRSKAAPPSAPPLLLERPGRLTCAAFPPSPSGRFGDGPKRLRSLFVAGAREHDETGRGQRGFLDRHVWVLLEQALKPAGRDPRVPARILAGDQHGQLERIGEAELRQLFGRRHGRDNVSVLDRLLKDAV
jgi:hypothetical protein